MKKVLFLCALLAAIACGPKKEDQTLAYLNKLHPGVTFTIKQADETVPLYDPRMQLISIAGAVADHAKGDLTFDEVENVAREFEEVLSNPERYAEEHPDRCNTTGFHAWVEANGQILDVVFFYDGGGKQIINSTLELQNRYNELLKTVFDF